eukprot:363292-Chlamydomonas_euryale.AAC.7
MGIKATRSGPDLGVAVWKGRTHVHLSSVRATCEWWERTLDLRRGHILQAVGGKGGGRSQHLVVCDHDYTVACTIHHVVTSYIKQSPAT